MRKPLSELGLDAVADDGCEPNDLPVDVDEDPDSVVQVTLLDALSMALPLAFGG